MIKTVVNGNWELMLPKHRNKFLSDNEWEPERLLALRNNIDDSDVVADIGAEEGDLTALMASWAKGIYIFEPSPMFWPNIRATFQANKLPTPLGCFAGFVAEKETDAYNLNYDPKLTDEGWPGCAYGEISEGVGFRHLSQETDATVQVTLDRYFLESKNGKQLPSVLNIDVEGSELRVLKGATKLLNIYHPLVFVSIHPQFMEEMYGETLDDVIAFMRNFGYEEKLLAIDHEHHYVFSHILGKVLV